MATPAGRVLVAGHAPDGEAIFVSDGEAPVIELDGPEVVARFLFGRDAPPVIPDGGPPATLAPTPPPGGCRATTLSIGAGSNGLYHAFVRSALGEMADPAEPGFHATPTFDIVVVLAGELLLELDRSERRLATGDMAVLTGVRHRWSNPGAEAATLLAVQLGAEDARRLPKIGEQDERGVPRGGHRT